jgi:serine/threonine protein phosphatase PrpC
VPIESASVSPPVSCGACGEPTTGEDARCDACGRRPAGVEHAEDVLPPPDVGAAGPVVLGAGVTDRGHRRRRNEDAFDLIRVPTDSGDAVVAVVCDGVASVPGGATASRTACDVAVAAGREALSSGQDLDDAAATIADAARRAVAALAPGSGQAPACTYVAAVLDAGRAVVSWVGDSRAYWLCPATPEDSAVLTEDDSWAAEMVAAGVVGAEDALSDPRAHVITRWLAADAPDVVARHRSWALDDTGVLLLCSDGVWNHLPDPAVLASILASALPSDTTPADAESVHAGALALVDAALDDGGHDNATAVLLALGPVPDAGR